MVEDIRNQLKHLEDGIKTGQEMKSKEIEDMKDYIGHLSEKVEKLSEQGNRKTKDSFFFGLDPSIFKYYVEDNQDDNVKDEETNTSAVSSLPKNTISSIHERLDSNPFLIINGLGGIGKTTTTHEYIKRYKSDYNAIIVMNECDMKSNFYYNLRLLVEEGSFSSALKDKESSDEDIQKLILQKLKGNCFEKVLLVFDNVDTDDSIGYIKPYIQELSTLDSIHIMITSRIQSARVFSAKLFPNDKDDVMDIASCIYTVQKLSLCVSRRLMLKRLNLDENEIQELTEEGNQLLQEILTHFDGLPLALIQASGTLSDDLAKMRIKEGQLTKDIVNLDFQKYLDTYHEIFFN